MSSCYFCFPHFTHEEVKYNRQLRSSHGISDMDRVPGNLWCGGTSVRKLMDLECMKICFESFGLDSVVLTEGSILDSYHEMWESLC